MAKNTGFARGWPQVAPTDLVRNGYDAINDLGDAVARDVGGDDNLGTWTVTAQAGFTVNTVSIRKRGDVGYWYIALNKTGATLGPANSTGGLADTNICQLGGLVPLDPQNGNFVATSAMGGWTMAADGIIKITDMHPGSSIGAGDSIRINFSAVVSS